MVVAIGLGTALAASPAGAVVGAGSGPAPLGSSSVMVLSSRGGVCSAVVVAPDAVLTAAHCVGGASEVRVHLPLEGREPVLIDPVAKAVHPEFRPDAVRSRRRSVDLALLRLPIPLPSRFAPAALSEGTPAAATPMLLGGYGVAREGDGRSSGTFRQARLATSEPYGRSSILIWLTDPSGRGAGACEGDSGGPIAGGDGHVVAITGWASGVGSRSCGDVSQGVLVGPQRSWIDRTLTGWGRAAEWRAPIR